VVEDLDRLALENGLGEEVRGHVRSAPGAVHGEKAQARARQTIQVAVGVRHEFIGFFGGRVQAGGVIRAVLDAVGQFVVESVNGTGGGEDEVLYFVLAAGFQNVAETDQIGLDVALGMCDAVAHSGLGRQMRHTAEVVRLAKGVQNFGVRQIHPSEREGCVLFQQRQAIPLELHVVILIQIIQADNAVALPQKVLRQVKADESRSAGNQDMHSVPRASNL